MIYPVPNKPKKKYKVLRTVVHDIPFIRGTGQRWSNFTCGCYYSEWPQPSPFPDIGHYLARSLANSVDGSYYVHQFTSPFLRLEKCPPAVR